MDDFNTRVQSLPVELFNEIYNLTSMAAPCSRTIDKDYKPPHLLRINRHNRALFSKSYYESGAIFCMHLKILETWMPYLEEALVEQIAEIRLLPQRASVNNQGASLEAQRAVFGMVIESAAGEMRRCVRGTRKWDEMFKMQIYFPDGGLK